MKLFKIEADEVILYHKTFFVEAKNQTEARLKLQAGDWFDCESSQLRGETTYDKTRIISIEDTEAQPQEEQK